METKKMVEDLKRCAKITRMEDCIGCYYKGSRFGCYHLIKIDAADRLEEQEVKIEELHDFSEMQKEEIAELKKQLSEKQPEWISVEDGKEMPDAFSYTGIRHNQFPRLVVAIDENSHVTHWMMLDAPKPKEPTFYEKFLEAFPNNRFRKDDPPAICRNDVFGYMGRCPMKNTENYVDCDVCWNQPYFEPEEEGEADV